MVQIKIKGINHTCHIYIEYDEIQEVLKEMDERLLRRNDNFVYEVVFHLSKLIEKDIKLLFSYCIAHHILILGMNPQDDIESMEYYEMIMKGGQQYNFKKPALLLTNIESGAYVSSRSLYVIGGVYGMIDLLYAQDVLCCSSIDAYVRICDSTFQKVTSFSLSKVYYQDGSVVLCKRKEEAYWAKQLPLHQEKEG